MLYPDLNGFEGSMEKIDFQWIKIQPFSESLIVGIRVLLGE
jgi:hypothetical protein